MNQNEPSLVKVVVAFAAVYILWGSTYLGIAIAIESVPPFLLCGLRFIVAGAVLMGLSFLKSSVLPTRKEWFGTAKSGLLLILGGNMSVVWAEQYVPSAVVAIIIASVPIWFVVFDTEQRSRLFTNKFLLPGLLIGFSGVIYLTFNGNASHHGDTFHQYLGIGVVIIGTICWAGGTMLSRKPDHPTSTLLKSGMQMLIGGVVTTIISGILGEFSLVTENTFNVTSISAIVYLIIFGSLIGYSAYVWLVKVRPPAQVGTYAYVNPVVAVLLGWGFHDEPVTIHTITALTIILSGVFLVNQSFRVPKNVIKRPLT